MRNADRLDPLSSLISLINEVGNHTQKRDIVVYSLRGVMEICRLLRRFHFEIPSNYFEQWSN